MNRNVFGCLDSKADSISSNFQNGDLDVVGKDNFLIFLTANNQHSCIPLLKVSTPLRRNTRPKNTNTFQIKAFKFWSLSGKLDALYNMKKYLLSTICLTFLLIQPIYAQETVSRNLPIRLATVSETNYLNQLALKGFNLDTQGLLIESLDGRTVYADLNSSVGFNPASVIKVATSFAAIAKLGPDYHFETTFYTDGDINKKTRTLTGNLVLQSSGDPLLTPIDVARLVRDVVHAGIARVTGNLVVTGPLTYGLYESTERATVAVARALRTSGVKLGGVVNGGTPRGTQISTHVSSSLRDILFYQNAHSVNRIAERLGEALGGPKAIERFLIKDLGIGASDVSITSTSGLYFNRITPHATVMMLRELVFWLNLNNMQPNEVLPTAGMDAGTLQRRFTGQEYRGAIVGKTGTLPATDGGVSTLAGVLYTRDHGPVLFAIFNTKGSVSTYRKLQDDFLKGFIAESGGIPDISGSLHRLNN